VHISRESSPISLGCLSPVAWTMEKITNEEAN
jgi:hypothetical protein